MNHTPSSAAAVIGGSNGIGLAIAAHLIKTGHFVYVLDIQPVDPSLEQYHGLYEYIRFDVRNPSQEVLRTLKENPDLHVLMITAGIGRMAEFENLNSIEIKKTIDINLSVIPLIHEFYGRIKSDNRFLCGVMCSIAGMLSSPMFSVYSATKAALVRFIESVNIELEADGIANRILNVSPGAIQGTCFYGGANDPEQLSELAEQIVSCLENRQEIYIPRYAEVYKDVLSRYQQDPHAFGLSSYRYKKESGRMSHQANVKVGYLSGTFDLFHVGHLNLLERAKQQCDYLIVGVHRDASHKGREAYIPFDERMRIVGSCKHVDQVVVSCPEDSDAWNLWHFDLLFVGSDYQGSERFLRYEQFFQDKNVRIVYFPYTDSTSSTQIRHIIQTRK